MPQHYDPQPIREGHEDRPHHDLSIGDRIERFVSGMGKGALQLPAFFLDLATYSTPEDYETVRSLVVSRAIARTGAWADHWFNEGTGFAAALHGYETPARLGRSATGGMSDAWNWYLWALDAGEEVQELPDEDASIMRNVNQWTSAMLLAPQVAQTNKYEDLHLLDPETWEISRELSKDISRGQAFYFMLARTDVLDEQQVAQWADSDLFKYASGTIDGMARFFTDPDILIGKGIRTWRGAKNIRGLGADRQISEHLDGMHGRRIDRFIDRIVENPDMSQAEKAHTVARKLFPRHDVDAMSKAAYLTMAETPQQRRAVWEVIYGKGHGIEELNKMGDLAGQAHGVLRNMQVLARHAEVLQGSDAAARTRGRVRLRSETISDDVVRNRALALANRLEDLTTEMSGTFAHIAPRLRANAEMILSQDPNKLKRLEAELADTMLTTMHADSLANLWQSQGRLSTWYSIPSFARRAAHSEVTSTILQKSGMNRPFELLFNRRPHHMVDFHDANMPSMVERSLRQSGASQSTINDFANRAAQARGDAGQMARVWSQANDVGMRAVLKQLREKHGVVIPEGQVETILREARTGHRAARTHVERQYSAHGESVIHVPNGPGKSVTSMDIPMFRSQQPNFGFTPDWAGIRRTLERHAEAGILPRAGEIVHDIPVGVLDSIMYYWKANVLLRGAWPIRVTGLDEFWRMASKLGGIEALRAARIGPRNFTAAVGRKLGYDDAPKAMKHGAVAGGIMGALAGGASPTGALLGGAVGAGAGAAGMRVVSNLAKLERMGIKWDKFRKAGFSPPFGNPGDESRLYLSKASSRQYLDEFMEVDANSRRIARELRRDPQRWETIPPGDQRHLVSWQEAINKQFRNDELARRILRGDETEDLVKWLKSPDGLRYQRSMERPEIQDAHMWVKKARAQIENATPGPQGDQLRQIALDRPVSTEDLTRLYPDVANRPPVHGEAIAESLGQNQASRMLHEFIESGMEILGQYPTDQLVRFPMFEILYRRNLERFLTNRFPNWQQAPEAVRIKPETMRSVEHAARTNALKQVRQLTYDLAERTEFHHMMRLVHPFLPAVQEVATTWARLTGQNPQFSFRALHLWFGLDNIRGISRQDQETGETWLTFPVPEFMKDIVNHSFFRTALDDQGFVEFPKAGFNLILQAPFGLGPFVQAPMSEVLRHRPDLEDNLEGLLNIIMPYGPSRQYSDAFLASWQRRSLAALSGWWNSDKANQEYTSYYMRTLNTMIAEMQTGSREQIDFNDEEQVQALFNEAGEKTNRLFALRAFVAFFSPGQPVFQSPFWMHEQAYRQMIEREQEMDPEARARLNREWGTPIERFADAYGDEMFWVLQSFSRSNDGIPADQSALQERRELEDLVERFPEYGGLIIGRDITSEQMKFSSAVYDYQLRTPVRPGDPETMRERLAPRELMTNPEVAAGWTRWSRFRDWLEAERIDRGLPTLTSRGGEDLVALEEQMRDTLAREYPQWGREMERELSIEPHQWRARIQDFRVIAFESGDPGLHNRRDIEGLREYINIRDRYVEKLRQRKAAGRPHTMRAGANMDLRIMWETEVNQLLERNLHFAPTFYRYLERDIPGADD